MIQNGHVDHWKIFPVSEEKSDVQELKISICILRFKVHLGSSILWLFNSLQKRIKTFIQPNSKLGEPMEQEGSNHGAQTS